MLAFIVRDGFTLARSLELNEQWSCIARSGHVGCLDWASLENGPRAGLLEFQARVGDAIDAITDFVKKVVVSRKDFAVQGWRDWILEDPLVHPFRWLRSDLVPPAPFLVCDSGITVGGSGILVEPHAIDEQFRRAWMPFFCRGDRGHADLDAFLGQLQKTLLRCLMKSNSLLLLGTCCMGLSRLKSLLLGAWMVGAGENSRLSQLLGLISWHRFSPSLRKRGFGRMGFWMHTLP